MRTLDVVEVGVPMDAEADPWVLNACGACSR